MVPSASCKGGPHGHEEDDDHHEEDRCQEACHEDGFEEADDDG